MIPMSHIHPWAEPPTPRAESITNTGLVPCASSIHPDDPLSDLHQLQHHIPPPLLSSNRHWAEPPVSPICTNAQQQPPASFTIPWAEPPAPTGARSEPSNITNLPAQPDPLPAQSFTPPTGERIPHRHRIQYDTLPWAEPHCVHDVIGWPHPNPATIRREKSAEPNAHGTSCYGFFLSIFRAQRLQASNPQAAHFLLRKWIAQSIF